ncbi:hypothetical protein CDAR_241031 [Caerostris darwini]|uniref:Secreted protein n=1 Tax=Caerostris darwini TaxID=1538125 RepID=A0AAV4TJA9_9ARAC|nr:hypothetical protein CDAR_241031 [Caerostris darwini]
MFLLAFGQSLMESVICIVGHLLTYQKPLSGVAISRIDYYVWAFRDKGQLCAWVACQRGRNNLLFIVSTPLLSVEPTINFNHCVSRIRLSDVKPSRACAQSPGTLGESPVKMWRRFIS